MWEGGAWEFAFMTISEVMPRLWGREPLLRTIELDDSITAMKSSPQSPQLKQSPHSSEDLAQPKINFKKRKAVLSVRPSNIQLFLEGPH